MKKYTNKHQKKYAQIEGNDRFIYHKYDERNNEINWDYRSEFIRDRDRIIYTKSFRRLQQKAQVYSPGKGDHYRTRLTHTLEVNQIARGLARNLDLNETLTEAIALGHDIGHTPFGHAGEEVLDDIMRGKDDLGGKIEYKVNYGGFKHNFNSLNILENIEKKYEDIDGLNLTWQVLEGIVKHTKLIKIKDGKNIKWDWKRYVKEPAFYENIIEYDFNDDKKYSEKTIKRINSPLTLEGQVVNISDEIAQIQHDLDDSFRNWIKSHHDLSMFKNIKMIIESINNKLKERSMINNEFYEIYKKHFKYIELILDELLNLDDNKTPDDLKFIWRNLIRTLIIYFKEDVTINTKHKLNKNIIISKKHKIKNKDGKLEPHKIKCYKENVVYFSEVGNIVYKQLDTFLKNRLINSYEVACFDGKGKFIIKQLFKAYYENPRQMPEEHLEKLEKLIKNNCEKYGESEFNGIDITKIKFNSDYLDNINSSAIKKLIELLKLKNLNTSLKEHLDFLNSLNSKKVINLEDLNNIPKTERKYVECCLENHYSYLKVILDFISEMTDNFAKDEYKKLYI